jgi:hypothetical protein
LFAKITKLSNALFAFKTGLVANALSLVTFHSANIFVSVVTDALLTHMSVGNVLALELPFTVSL